MGLLITRRYHVRIPLFKPKDICQDADEIIGDADCVIDWNDIFNKQNLKNVNPPSDGDPGFSSNFIPIHLGAHRTDCFRV